MQSVVVEDLELRRPQGGFRLGPLSLRLATGSRTALIGPSGCGKSTLLRCIAGLERGMTGDVSLGDKLVASGGRQLLPPEQRRIGFVFQDGALWPHLTALQHLRFVDRAAERSTLLEQLARVGLADKADRRPNALSGGEAQRLALARALAGQPEVLLLDEPLGAVDVHLRDELGLLIRDLAIDRAVTLVVVTHDRDEALAMADDVAVLRDGQLVEYGTALELLERPRTGFSASFLCHAVCLRLERGAAGFRSALASVELPADVDPDDFVHAVLPGDVEAAPAGERAAATALVQQIRTDSFGRRTAIVVLDAQVLQLSCGPELRAGSQIGLRLRSTPRVLPWSSADAIRVPAERGTA